MPIPVPKASEVKEKFKRRVSIARPEYEFRISVPLKNWEEEYAEAWDRIMEGIREALEQGRFVGGVRRRGLAHWKSRTVRKGPPRWADETPRSADDYEKEISDYLGAIAATALGKKKRKGDPANIDQRVKPIVQALRLKKLEKQGVKAGV